MSTARVHARQTSAEPIGVVREHRRLAAAIGVMAVGLGVALILLWLRSGAAGFTGVAVTVPACPGDVQGCRVFVTHASDGSPVAHQDWSDASTTLNIVLPAGRYGIAAQGCRGDSIPMSTVTVASGFHTAVDLGRYWELPSFSGRTCPGFTPSVLG
jgi:hypothetical protein